ncbi:hypothetical protein Q6A86_08115 [Aliarcobacter skirrowii]|nr:hypothetical protein [Aliarcobacter skirrowii]
MIQTKNKKPKLVFGPVPIINNKYWSQALEENGYFSQTLVFDFYHINEKKDFDIYYEDFYIKLLGKFNKLFVDYLVFFYVLVKFDICHFSFDGGFLQKRFFVNYLEFFVYKTFGKKTVILPYGSDIYQYSKIIDIPWKHALIANYPQYGKKDKVIRRRVEFIQNNSSFVFAYIDYVFMLSYWDMLTVGAYIIDEDVWKYDRKKNLNNGKNGLVKIVHVPNHRGVKGTEFVYKAIENLKQKGYDVELVLIENMKNDEVKETLKECDILVDQLNLGYALNAIEGMSLSMPVITNLTNENYVKVFKQYGFLNECPLVSADFESLEQKLEELIVAPTLREYLGKQGVDYFLKYHSKKTFSTMMINVYDKIWDNQPLDLINYFHPVIGKYNKDIKK